MTTIHPSPLLRQALLADATTSGAFGLLTLLAAGPLSHLFGLPEMLLRGAGAVLLPYAALLAWLSLRDGTHRILPWAVILGNVLWAADSMLLLVSGWVSPTAAGTALVIAQALVVLMYAELQFMGLRRSDTPRAA